MLLNYSAGEVISDETIVANASEDQFLSHDTIFDVEVWSGPGKTGEQLVSGTDYSLVLLDSFNSVYNGIRFITNNGNSFYITYKTKGDYVDADDVNSKADKVASPTAGNFAGLDANGNLTDSTSKASDFATSGHVHSAATTEVAGFMSTEDKTKLTGIADNANNYTHPATHSADIITDGTTNKAYTATEKTKLTGIAENANNYTHPNHSGDVTSTADGATAYNNTVPVAKGGTGQTSYTDGQLLIGNTTGSTLAKATLTQGTGITITNGAGSITIANASPNETHTGDVTGGSALTIANDAVTNAKMANMVANSLKGNATADSADPSDISIAANKFPARASTGNLEAKSITDFGLGLVAAANAAAGRTALGALGSANITQTISNGVTDKAPSEDAVYDALALKAPLASPTFTGTTRVEYLYGTTQNHWHFQNAMLRNVLYAADKRFTVTVDTPFTNQDLSKLFDDVVAQEEYRYNHIPVGETRIITISFGTSITYPGGRVFISNYHAPTESKASPQSISARFQYDNGTWSSPVSGTVYSLTWSSIDVPGTNFMRKMEITITAQSAYSCIVNEIEYLIGNDDKSLSNPLVVKNRTNDLYFNTYLRTAGNVLTGGLYPTTGGLNIAKIYPVANSTTAIQLTKADGTTPVMTMDTTNSRIGIGKTPTAKLSIYGTGDNSNGLLQLESSSTNARGTLMRAGYYSYWSMDNVGLTYWAWGLRYDGEANQWVRAYTAANNYLPYIRYSISSKILIGGANTDSTSDTTPTPEDRFEFDIANRKLAIKSGYVELNEISAPSAGAADTGRLFLQDNGSGKTQLCVRFSSGATQVIATEP